MQIERKLRGEIEDGTELFNTDIILDFEASNKKEIL